MKRTPSVIVLAGGLGTRLQSIVSDRPKVMAPVLDRPFLEWQLEQLARAGLQRFVLAVGYLAQKIRDYFGDGSQWGWRITYSVESTPLGTAGAVRNAARAPDTQLHSEDPFMVMNGDTYLETDFGVLLDAHLAGDCFATIALVHAENASRYGRVHLADTGVVSAFDEKCPKPAAGLVNAGVYVFAPRVLDLIPDGRAVSMEREVFPKLLSLGRAMQGVTLQGPFVDIGTPEGYGRIVALLGKRRSSE